MSSVSPATTASGSGANGGASGNTTAPAPAPALGVAPPSYALEGSAAVAAALSCRLFRIDETNANAVRLYRSMGSPPVRRCSRVCAGGAAWVHSGSTVHTSTRVRGGIALGSFAEPSKRWPLSSAGALVDTRSSPRQPLPRIARSLARTNHCLSHELLQVPDAKQRAELMAASLVQPVNVPVSTDGKVTIIMSRNSAAVLVFARG